MCVKSQISIGLQHPAEVVSDDDDSNVCPKHHVKTGNTPKTTLPTPTESNDNDHGVTTPSSTHNEIFVASSTNNVVSTTNELPDEKNQAATQNILTERPNHPANGISIFGLTLITGTIAIILVFGMLCLLWRRYPPRRKYGRYKSFLPVSLRTDDGGIAIPTIGLPRSNKAEAEILIPEDEDDDEI